MAELKINIETDTSKVHDLSRQIGNAQKEAESLGGTLRAINRAAGGKELYFATTKARDGFVSLLNEANKLEKAMSDPKMQGTANFKQMSDRLADVRGKLTGMASSAAMAGKVMSTSFAREVSDATRAVQQMEQQMVVAKRNIEKIQSQMGDRSVVVKRGGGDIQSDKVYQGLSVDLGKQKDSLKGLETSLQSATSRLNNMRDAQRVFGTATIKVADDTNVFLEKLNQIPVVGQATTGVFSQMRRAMGDVSFALLGGLGFEQLGVRIFHTRSMMQNLEISFETMLQSADKASALMGELTQTAAKTPFGMMEVTNGAKQLLAYGTAAEDVNGILIKLGDISAGLGLSLGDLVYLYGTTMAQGRMFTQDLRQFMGRGIPMAEEIGKILVAQGKATKGTQAEVQDAVTKGKVNAEMVKLAIENMTAAGSRFGGLMEKQSSTLEGQWSNIEDTVDMMFNDMGKSTEGVFNSALTVVTTILDNWQSIVKVIGSAIAAVGLYKTGLAAASLIERDTARNTKDALLGSIDERIAALKERENVANATVGYNIAGQKTSEAQSGLGKLVSDSSLTEEQFNRTLAEARANGIINDELEQELRLKREILMEQEKLTAQAEQEADKVGKSSDAETPIDLDTAYKQRNETKQALDEKEKELDDLNVQLQAAKEEYLKSNLEDYRNAKEGLPTLQKDYDAAKNNRLAAEAEYNRYKSPEYDAQINGQEMRTAIAGARYGEDSVEYQAELTKLDELKGKREQAKLVFQEACDAETASLQKVKEAQDALNSSTQSPVGQKAARVVELDDKIEKQQSVVDKAFEVGNDETDFEYRAAKQSLEELRAERQLAVEEYQAACAQEIESLQKVIDKQNELNGATNGEMSPETPQVGTDGNSAADAVQAAAEAREHLTQAQEDGKDVDEAVVSVQERLSNAAQMAGEAEVTNVASTEANTVAGEDNAVVSETKAAAKENEVIATETGTVATEADTVADKTNAKAKKVAQLQSAQKAAQQQKETLSTKLNAAQTQVDTLWQEQDAAAKGRNGIASALLGAKNALMGKLSAAGAVGQRVFNAAVNECTVAMNNLKMALLSNPITAIFTILTTVGTGLMMFWDNLFGSEDEAETATTNFTNAAKEAASKTDQLYAQMNASANGTKAHKEAMDELIKTCEEYGIKLNETVLKGDDEVKKAEELNRVHQALTDTLKQEAIQQEYLNSLKSADANASDTSQANRDSFNEGRNEDYFSKEEWSGALTQIEDEQIQKAGELKKAMDEINEAKVKSAEMVEKYNKLNEEYNDIVQKVIISEQSYTHSIMTSKGMQEQYGEAMAALIPHVKEYISKEADKVKVQLESYESSERVKEASEKAANATNGMTDAQANAAKAIRYSKMQTDELSAAASNLIKSMSGKVIGIGVEFKMWTDNINVPQWMLNKTSKDLSKDLQGWMNILNQMGDKNSIKVKGKGTMTKKEVLERIESNRQAMTQKKAEEDKKAEDDAAAKKERDKKKKKEEAARKKAEAAAKKEANEAEKRKTATEKANEQYNDAKASFAEKADESLKKNDTDAMEEGTAKELKKIEDSTRQLIDGIDKQTEKLVEARKKQAETVWLNSAKGRKASDWKNTAEGKKSDEDWWNEIKKEVAKDSDGNEIKDEAGKAMTFGDLYEAQITDVQNKAAKEREEIRKKELESYRDFVMDYGTVQQQRNVIDAKYEEERQKIIKSNDTDEQKKWQLASLDKEHQSNISSLTAQGLTEGIDWKALMTGVGSMSIDVMKTQYDKLLAYTKEDAFLSSDAQSQQKVTELIGEMRQYLGSENEATWSELGEAVRLFNESVVKFQQAQQDEANAYAKLKQAGEDLRNGNITQEEYDIIKAAAEGASQVVASAQEDVNKKGAEANQKTDEVKNQVSSLTSLLTKGQDAWGGTDGYGNVLGSSKEMDSIKGNLDTILASLPVDSIASKIGSGVSDALGGMSSTLSKGLSSVFSSGIGQMVGIIAQLPSIILSFVDSIKQWITGILDSFSELLSFSWLEDFVNSILEAIGKLIDTVLDLPENIYHVVESIVVNGIGGLLNTVVGRLANIVSFGALDSDIGSWFQSGNAERIQKEIADLSDRNEILMKSIDALTEELQKQGGSKAIMTAEKLLEYQQEQIANTKKIYQDQMAYSASHHSFNFRWSGFTDEEIERMNKQFDRKAGNEWKGDWNDLTPDEMKLLLADADITEHIKNTGAELYANNVYDDLEKYAELAGVIQDTIDTLNEQLTGTTFDSLKDSFVSSLMDMESSAEDFANNFTEMLMQAVLQARISDALDDQIEEFYKTWAEYSSGKKTADDGTQTVTNEEGLNADEIAKLKARWQEITEQGIAIRDEVAQFTGYDKSYNQEASSGAYQAMSQEVGEELNGRFTAVQEATEGTWYQTQLINQKLSNILGMEDTSGLIDESAEDNTVCVSYDTEPISTQGNILAAFAEEMSQKNADYLSSVQIADESRTILAQMQLSIASIDDRQQGWEKPFKTMFAQIKDIRDDIHNKL